MHRPLVYMSAVAFERSAPSPWPLPRLRVTSPRSTCGCELEAPLRPNPSFHLTCASLRQSHADELKRYPSERFMELLLLYPEWQSYGENPAVHHGAIKLAEVLFAKRDFMQVEVPAEETLDKTKGILGLSSIAPRFQRTIKELRNQQPTKIFMIGGTCGVEVAPVGYLNEKYQGDLAVVWFDAHGDLNNPTSSPSGHFHGMALRTLLGDGPTDYVTFLKHKLSPNQIFLAGSRELDPPEEAFITKAGISVIWPEEFAQPGVIVERIKTAGFKNIYVHLDLDVLNPNSFSNSLMQTSGGPSLMEVQNSIEALAQSFNAVGFSIVEYCEHQKDNSLNTLRDLVNNSGITSGWN
jgi:arginase